MKFPQYISISFGGRTAEIEDISTDTRPNMWRLRLTEQGSDKEFLYVLCNEVERARALIQEWLPVIPSFPFMEILF